jgi:hypothetical protein
MLLLAFAMSLTQLDAAPAPAPRPEARAVSISGEFEIADAAEARAQAASIVTVAIDHVGVPRGINGICLVQGRLTQVVRGSAMTRLGPVEVNFPCTSSPSRSGPRRIVMSGLRAASSANLYLSRRGILLDFEPLPR